ncbi:hypothetical protein T459_18515 [Capsicum annuum]|uniref:Bifunctional inhibitor/plant lipid transfer protein/seed storage helical domain-containing protein n=1 Tax=Capsicum annuum TaxID=4072 RepID=A0A2G2ZEN4_CAPAN|nr:hypothetical protein T459_18515 [Capsicum annuum]
MASKINVMALVMVLSVAIFFNGALGQSSCMTTLVGLSPCLNYVSGNSSTPSSSCCTSLAGVVQSNPQCLCMLVNGGGSNLGIAINQTLALGLPSACNLQTPPLSRCNAANGPTASVPASSPTGSTTPSDSSNEIPATPSGTGSNCFMAINDPFLMAMSLCDGTVASSCLCRGVINNITMLMAKFKLVVASLSVVLGHHRFLPD